MKKLFIFLIFFAPIAMMAQVQYGGVIRAKSNPGTLGEIYRNGDALKVYDSILAALLSGRLSSSISLKNNAGTYGDVQRNVDMMKTWDSITQAILTAGIKIKESGGNAFTSNSTNLTSKFALDNNLLSIQGNLIDVNSGNKSNGTQRVVLATDQPALSTGLSVTGTVKYVRGTPTTLTVTNLNSLASSATAGWQSVRIDNITSTLATDYLVNVKVDMANTAPANDKAVYVYICPFYYDGSTWYASSAGTTTLPSGSEGTYTISSSGTNLKLLGVLNYQTADMIMQDTWLVSGAFGKNMPDGFSIIIINFTGAAIAGSGNIVQYTAINNKIQ